MVNLAHCSRGAQVLRYASPSFLKSGGNFMSEDLGKLVLRITLGSLLLFHGMHKLLNGIAPIKAMVAAHNIPEVAAYGVYLGEIAGPLMVLLGLFARVGGALIAVNMLVAVFLA